MASLSRRRKREADDDHDDWNNKADTKIQKYNYTNTIQYNTIQLEITNTIQMVYRQKESSDGRMSTFMNYVYCIRSRLGTKFEIMLPA